MTTSARYTLLPMQERSQAEDGAAYRSGRRTDWELLLRLAKVGTSVEVVFQASGAGTADEDFRDLDSWTLSIAGASTKDPGTQPRETDLWVRAITRNVQGGDYELEVVGRAPFFNLEDGQHTDRLSQRLRDWDRTDRDPLIERAERTVLTRLGGMSEDGTLQDLDLLSAQAPELIRQAIVAQAELEYKRQRAMKSDEMSATYTSRGPRFPQIAEDAESALEPIIEGHGLHVVRHR